MVAMQSRQSKGENFRMMEEFEEPRIHDGIIYSHEETISDHLWYYKIKDTDTKLFWIPHPRGHRKLHIDSNELIENIYELI